MKTEEIIKKACEIHHITVDEFLSGERSRPIPDARAMVSFVLRKRKYATLKKIGKNINKHHSTVIHHLKVHNALYTTDKSYKERFDLLDNLLPFHDYRNSIKYSIKYYGL